MVLKGPQVDLFEKNELVYVLCLGMKPEEAGR